MKKLVLMTAICVVAAPAFANEPVGNALRSMLIQAGGKGSKCELKEQATINVSFNQRIKSFAEAKTIHEGYLKKVSDYAQQQHIKLKLQSQSFNVSSQRNYEMDEAQYNMSGNMSYLADDTDGALKFAEFLTKEKMQVNINSSAYNRNSNCSWQEEGTE